MGYMLPLRFIKVSQKNDNNGQTDVAVCATRIVAVMSTEAFQARRTIKEEKRAGTLINAAGKLAVKSAIFLDNGSVIASPLSVTRIMSAIEKSNFKEASVKRWMNTVRMKVYDVVDEQPDESIDEDVHAVTVEGGEDDYAGELEEVFIDDDEESASKKEDM